MKKNIRPHFTHLNGILAILFGAVALLFPGITLKALGIYFAISIIIGGFALVAGSFRAKRENTHWYFLLLEGMIGLFIGIIILARPEVVATVFVTIIGLWAVIIGLILLFAWFKRSLPPFLNTFLLIISFLSIGIGVVIIVNPFESTRIITILIGIYALVYGLFSVINSSKIYR